MHKGNKTVRKIALFGAAIVIGAAVLVMAAASQLNAQVPSAEEPATQARALVGTYNAQKAFEQYPGRKKLMDAYQSAQADMGKAQEEGNQEELLQIQQRLEKTQQEVIDKFQKDVRDALPDIAKKTGVKVIALEVVYTVDDVETTDVTAEVTEAIGGELPEQGAQQPMIPQQK